MIRKALCPQVLLVLFIILTLFTNNFVGGKEWTKMATDASQPQMTSTKLEQLSTDSIIFETNCKHNDLYISSTCHSDSTDDQGKCNLFKSRSSTNGPENLTSNNVYQYSHFPCRTWKIIDTKTRKIRLHFNGFHSRKCCSELRIFDGPNSTHTKLFSKTNIGNHLVPVNITSTDNTLFLYYISNVSLIASSLDPLGFHMSYSMEEEDDYYQYDYSNEQVDYIVLDLPDYYDDSLHLLDTQNDSISQSLGTNNHVSPHDSFPNNPFITLIANHRDQKNILEEENKRSAGSGDIYSKIIRIQN